LIRWEAFCGLGEEPPVDWTRAIEPGLREELERRIQRRKRLNAFLDLTGPGIRQGPGPDAALPSFPGYETPSRIGHGGMGAVYKALYAALDRIVAIKTIADGRFATSDQRERFRAEVRAVARLREAPAPWNGPVDGAAATPGWPGAQAEEWRKRLRSEQ
jgi:hypothetical protein